MNTHTTNLQQMEMVLWNGKVNSVLMLCCVAVFAALVCTTIFVFVQKSRQKLQHSLESSWMPRPPQTPARGFLFEG